MSLHPERSREFLELSTRERVLALLDADTPYVELLGPFDRLTSPWLKLAGIVPQADDGVVVVRGTAAGREVVLIAIEPAFEGGSIGEAGGAKIVSALELALESCIAGQPVAAALLLETGGVRLSEANLGLAMIAQVHSAIVALREHVPTVAVIAGPVGCFGGMSLAAALCTWRIGTRYGRYGMNGPEVIEQEAGPDEMEAADRDLVWSTYGCEARMRDGWIDALVSADAGSLCGALHEAFAQQPVARSENAHAWLTELRTEQEVLSVA